MKCCPQELEGWGLVWVSGGLPIISGLLIHGVVASFGLWLEKFWCDGFP